MPYYKQEWRNNDPATPISAARLEHMEQGIFDAHELEARQGEPGPQGPAGVAGPAGEPGEPGEGGGGDPEGVGCDYGYGCYPYPCFHPGYFR